MFNRECERGVQVAPVNSVDFRDLRVPAVEVVVDTAKGTVLERAASNALAEIDATDPGPTNSCQDGEKNVFETADLVVAKTDVVVNKTPETGAINSPEDFDLRMPQKESKFLLVPAALKTILKDARQLSLSFLLVACGAKPVLTYSMGIDGTALSKSNSSEHANSTPLRFVRPLETENQTLAKYDSLFEALVAIQEGSDGVKGKCMTYFNWPGRIDVWAEAVKNFLVDHPEINYLNGTGGWGGPIERYDKTGYCFVMSLPLGR